jgi:curved DNA-binding protein CbpA
MNYHQALDIFDLTDTSHITIEEFKVLYKKVARELHPDRKSGDTKKFVKLKEAFDFLGEFSEFKVEVGQFKESTDLVPVDMNQLSLLSRDELMKKYKHDRTVLEKQVNLYRNSLVQQETTISSIKNIVQQLMNDYEDEKRKLQHSLDMQIENLEKAYKPTFINRIFFFLPKMSKKEFWDRYNTSVSQYSRKYEELNLSFFKILVATYGDGLNTITLQLESSKK